MSTTYTVRVRAYLMPMLEDKELFIVQDEDLSNRTFQECLQHIQTYKSLQHHFSTGHDFQIIPE